MLWTLLFLENSLLTSQDKEVSWPSQLFTIKYSIANKSAVGILQYVTLLLHSPLFSGHRDLWKESERSICNSILKPLMAYFCSNSEIDLISGLEMKCCVISLAHTLEYDQKRKQKRPRNRPPPENHLFRHKGSSLKSIENFSGNNFGLILIPNGTPKEPRLFADKCMLISFCIGRMIYEASYQGEVTVKKLLFDLRGLSQRAKA